MITPSGPANEGQAYSLSCDLMGDESLAVRFRWDRLTPTLELGIYDERVLSFDPLSSDDEGQYRCTTTITSSYLTSTHSKNVIETITVIRKLLKISVWVLPAIGRAAAVSIGQCPELPSLDNGHVMITNQRFSGATATYTCDSGYELDLTSGSEVRTCQADGTWPGSAPACVGKYSAGLIICVHFMINCLHAQV